jgi:hypothetical protein
MVERRTKKEVTLSREWPFVNVTEARETREHHAWVSLTMAICSVGLVIHPGIPPALAAVIAFISGYAFNNWLLFEDAYEEVPGQ